VADNQATTYPLLSSVTTTATGEAISFGSDAYAIHAVVVGTGAVTAVVVIEASNFDGFVYPMTLGTITLSGTNSAADGFSAYAPWKAIRAKVTAVSGTGAAVSVLVGV